MMRLFFALLLIGAAVGSDKPKKDKKSDPRLKLKPHKWQTSTDDLEEVKSATPKAGTWAEKDFKSNDDKAPMAAKALEAREAAKAREQKSTSTTAKPAAKAAPVAKTTTTTTTTTTTPKAHKYWKPSEEKKPVAEEKKPVAEEKKPVAQEEEKPAPVVNFHASKSAAGAPSGPAAAMMKGPGPAPAPAPVPAPLTYEEQVAKLKGDMMAKIKGDSFDADLVIHRPTKVPPGPKSAGKEHPVPEFKDVGSDFGPYAGKPGFAPAAAPLKHDDISFKTGSLPVDAAHKNRETMTSDWHLEYGPNGPQGLHGARPQAGNFQPLQVR